MSGGFQLVSERDVHRGVIFRVSVGTFRGPDGVEFERDLVRHPGAVAVVPLVGADVVLVRQYRPALDAELLEIPAGIRDVDGEPLEETARRELAEEIGMTTQSLRHVVAVHNAVGFSDEQIDIFVATDLEPVERPVIDSPEEAAMDIVHVPVDTALEMVERAEITDAKTIIGLQAVRHSGR